MEAIEFQTTLENGRTISIPEDLAKRLHNTHVRVVVLEDESFVFDREETNDRELDRVHNYIRFRMANPFMVDKSIPFLKRDEIYDRGI